MDNIKTISIILFEKLTKTHAFLEVKRFFFLTIVTSISQITM